MIQAEHIKTAVVILNWNGKKYLEQFLSTVIRTTADEKTRVFVADNGSTDNSAAYLESEYPEISIIKLDKNYGFSEGYNRALAQIDAEYFVLLNSDVEPTPNWLQPMVELLDSDNTIAAAAPKLLSYHAKKKFEYAGAGGGYIDKFGYPFCKGRIISEIENDTNQYDGIFDVFWASGACLLVRAELYKKYGGLDKDFFAHMEEIDFCWRMKNLGYSIKNINTVHVYHVGGGTLPNNNPKKIYLNYRNNLLLLLKNLTFGKIFLTIFTRMILDGMSAFVYLVGGKFSFFLAVAKAHFGFYIRIPKYLKKRKESCEKIGKHPEMLQKSIVFEFFLKKKRTFDKLKF